MEQVQEQVTIEQILARPAEELASLSTAELTALLSPFFPAARTPVLPEEKAPKATVSNQWFKSAVKEHSELLARVKALNKV